MAILDETHRRTGGSLLKRLLPAAVICLWGLMGMEGLMHSSARAQDLVAPEYKVKAAFLFNFAKLTEWPSRAFADTNAPIIVGVLGRDSFGPHLEEVTRGRTVEGRRLVVARYNHVDEVRDCHVLFISGSESGRLSDVLSRLAGRPILTVSDLRQFARQGGAIGLVRRTEELRFEVNLEAVEASGLKLSSKLLRLADVVRAAPKGRRD